jgi:long-chain acyl-CoA synthetase
LLHGIPLILVRTALPESLKRAASQEPAVTLPAVPALWKMWHEADAVPGNVRLAISAGAPLPLVLEQSVFARSGLKIHNFYGSTECGGIAYDKSATPRQDGGCVGMPVSNVDARIGEDGCVEVRGRAVGQGYWPQEDPRLSGGVFRTSDLGEFRDGALFLNGRMGDLINVAGRKVFPETVERVLASYPGVTGCVVFGIPLNNGHRGESIIGCLATKAAVSVEDLRQFASARLQAWQVPREWWFVDHLNANGRGKLSRANLRQHYLKLNG